MPKKTKYLSLPQRALCNWMLFLHSCWSTVFILLIFHTDLFLYSELPCWMLYLQCVITSLISSLLEGSACCPSAPGTLVLPVHETRLSQWVHNACALTTLSWDTRTPFLLSPSPQPSSKPVPTHHANIRAVAISNSHSVKPSAEAATNQTPFHSLSPDWIHNRQLSLGQGVTLLIIFII